MENSYIIKVSGIIGVDFNIGDLLLNLNKAKNHNVLELEINSVGGYVHVANEMADILRKTGKTIITRNTGDVASAAVELFILPNNKFDRTFDPTKGQFLIHMPFLDPEDGGVTGTYNDIQMAADEMRELEKKLIKLYSEKTGTDRDIIEGFMKQNVPLTGPQIDELGFAVVMSSPIKAVAFLNNNNNSTKMTNEESKKLNGIEMLLTKIAGFLKPKNIMLQDVNGQEIDFGNEIEDPSQITVGTKATIGGAPAEGSFVFPDGSTLVFVAGEVTEIIPAQSEEMSKLVNENNQLKESLATLEKEFADFKASAHAQLSDVKKEFLSFKNQFSKGDPSTVATFTAEKTNTNNFRKAYKNK